MPRTLLLLTGLEIIGTWAKRFDWGVGSLGRSA